MNIRKNYVKTIYNDKSKPFTKYPNKLINYLIKTYNIKKDSKVSRMAAVDVIEEKFMTNYEGPSILTGDFNSTPNSKTLTLLQSRGWVLNKTNERLLTAPSSKPSFQIDYVMPRPEEKWKIIALEVIQEKNASDHLPILMTLELN